MRLNIRCGMGFLLCSLITGTSAVPRAASTSVSVSYYDVSFNSLDDHWLMSPCHALSSPPYYVTLSATATSVGANENFTLWDLNGGNLVDGDEVAIACDGYGSHDGYGLSVGSQDAPVRFDDPFPGGGSPAYSTWYLYDNDCQTGGCTVQSGHKLGFQNKATGNYLYAAGGGGGDVNADSSSPGNYGRFEIVF